MCTTRPDGWHMEMFGNAGDGGGAGGGHGTRTASARPWESEDQSACSAQ